MSTQQLTGAPARPAAAAAAPSAAQLAARIQIPRRLPPRYDGQPLQHLSHSSYNRFVLLPRGLAPALHPRGEDRPDRLDVPRPPGRRRDHALLPAHPRPRRAARRSTRSRTRSGTAGKPPPRPSASNSGSPGRPTCARTARSSSGSTRSSSPSAELIPHLGEPVAVQRKARVHARARPRVERAVLPRPRDPAARRRRAAAGGRRLQGQDHAADQYKADHDFQPAVYLAGRWLEGDPAAQFCFAQIAKPGPRRKADRRLDRDHEPIDRPAARRARPHRASRPPDRRLLRAVRPRRAMGIRRPERLEVQRSATARRGGDAQVGEGCRGAAVRAPYLISRIRDAPPELQRTATGPRCPLTAGAARSKPGQFGRLADHECRHGRLPFDPTPSCGCWPQEGAVVLTLPRSRTPRSGRARAA